MDKPPVLSSIYDPDVPRLIQRNIVDEPSVSTDGSQGAEPTLVGSNPDGRKGEENRASETKNSAVGTKAGAVGTRDGAVGTKDGAGGTKGGAVETKDGAIETTDVEVGTKNGEVETKDGAGGTKDGAGGTKDGAGGTKDGEVGTKDGEVGTKDGKVKTTDGEVGTKDVEVKTTDGAAVEPCACEVPCVITKPSGGLGDRVHRLLGTVVQLIDNSTPNCKEVSLENICIAKDAQYIVKNLERKGALQELAMADVGFFTTSAAKIFRFRDLETRMGQLKQRLLRLTGLLEPGAVPPEIVAEVDRCLAGFQAQILHLVNRRKIELKMEEIQDIEEQNKHYELMGALVKGEIHEECRYEKSIKTALPSISNNQTKASKMKAEDSTTTAEASVNREKTAAGITKAAAKDGALSSEAPVNKAAAIIPAAIEAAAIKATAEAADEAADAAAAADEAADDEAAADEEADDEAAAEAAAAETPADEAAADEEAADETAADKAAANDVAAADGAATKAAAPEEKVRYCWCCSRVQRPERPLFLCSGCKKARYPLQGLPRGLPA